MKPQVEFSINIPDKLRYLIHFKTSMHLLSTSSIDAKSSQLRIPILKYYELSSQSLSALLSSLSSSLNSGPPHQTAGLIGTQESWADIYRQVWSRCRSSRTQLSNPRETPQPHPLIQKVVSLISAYMFHQIVVPPVRHPPSKIPHSCKICQLMIYLAFS